MPRSGSSRGRRTSPSSPYRAPRSSYRRSPLPRSLTPPSRSPLRSHGARSPMHSRSPLRSRPQMRSRSPMLSRSPLRSPSPLRNRARSPMRSRSPLTRRGRSPAYNRSRSPLYSRGRSPPQPRARLPLPPRARSPLPPCGRSPLPPRARSPLPPRGRSPLPPRARSPLPPRARSPLPPRGRSPLPLRARLPLPPRAHSPLPPRGRSPLPPRGRTPPRRDSLVARMGAAAPLTGTYPPPLQSDRDRSVGARAPLFMQDPPSTAPDPMRIERGPPPPRPHPRDFRESLDRGPPPLRRLPPGPRRLLPPPMPHRGMPAPGFIMRSRLSSAVCRVAEELFMTGMFQPHDITPANIPHLELLPPDAAIAALDEYASLDKNRLNSPPAFFTGIIKRIGRGQPPPSGRPDRTLPPPYMPPGSLVRAKRPPSPSRRSPPPPRSRSLPRGPDLLRPPPPLMESAQRAPTSWAPVSTHSRERSRAHEPARPLVDVASRSISPPSPRRATSPDNLPHPPPLPPPPAAHLVDLDRDIMHDSRTMDRLPLSPSAAPCDDIDQDPRQASRRYNSSPPRGGYYLDGPRRASLHMSDYDRMPLSDQGPPLRGSRYDPPYDPPRRSTGFSGPPLMDMPPARGRLPDTPSPPYGPTSRRAASPLFRAPYGPPDRGGPYLAPPPSYREEMDLAYDRDRRMSYAELPPRRSSRAPLRSVATIAQPAGADRDHRGDRGSSLDRQPRKRSQERSQDRNGRHNSELEREHSDHYERERERERAYDLEHGNRERKLDDHYKRDSERGRPATRGQESEGHEREGREAGESRRSRSPAAGHEKELTGADLAAAGSDDFRGKRRRVGSPEASMQAVGSQSAQRRRQQHGRDVDVADAEGVLAGDEGNSQQPTFLDELLAQGDGVEGWEGENPETEEAGGGDAFDMSNLVDRKQVQKTRP